MITATALHHPSYLLRIKAAVLRAVAKTGKRHSHHGYARAEVFNRHGKPSLVVVARRGEGFKVYDDLDNDLTESVKAALTAYHATLPRNRIRLKNVRLSFPRLVRPSGPLSQKFTLEVHP